MKDEGIAGLSLGLMLGIFVTILVAPPFQDCGGMKENYKVETKAEDKEKCKYTFESSNLYFQTHNCSFNVGDNLKLQKEAKKENAQVEQKK